MTEREMIKRGATVWLKAGSPKLVVDSVHDDMVTIVLFTEHMPAFVRKWLGTELPNATGVKHDVPIDTLTVEPTPLKP